MTRYCLKAMVLARLFAESTVLVAFIGAPILLLLSGKMQTLALPVQVLFYFLAVFGLAILPWFGFLTWQVRVDERGLTTDALFKHQFCAWETMKKLTRRASWSWQRFVIEFDGGEIHFPVLLARSDELVQVIRQHLTGEETVSVGLSSQNPHRIFNYDPLSLIFSIVQSTVACVFVALFWGFFVFNLRKSFQSKMDETIILVFCLAFTVIFIWRLIVVLSMPKRIELTRDRLLITNLFSTKDLGWSDVLSLSTPLPLLPEGFTIKSKRGSFLVGTGMDAADELQEIVLQELAEQRDMQLVTEAIKMKLTTDGAAIPLEAPPVVEALQTDFAVPAESGAASEAPLGAKPESQPESQPESTIAESPVVIDFQPTKDESDLT